MTGYCCIFSIRAPSAALAGEAGAVTVRSVELRVGFVEVASESSVTRRIDPELARRRGYSSASVVHRVRIRRGVAGRLSIGRRRPMSLAHAKGAVTRSPRRPTWAILAGKAGEAARTDSAAPCPKPGATATMAIMIPDSCPSKATAGEKRAFGLLRDGLPDHFVAWYEPVVAGRYPDFCADRRRLRPAHAGGQGLVRRPGRPRQRPRDRASQVRG